MKKLIIATCISLTITAIPLVAEAAVYVGPVYFKSITTISAGDNYPFTTNSSTLHIYGVQSVDGGTSQPSQLPNLVYDLVNTNYTVEAIGTFTTSDWGYYWYGVPSGIQMNANAVYQYSYLYNRQAGPASTGNFFTSNS